ncbi:hypothetical protein An08g05620 [Aspergillus niger]|uniref:Uncharacterized protein n=2 Tax=Aspergillus niger TaxID=5061 RepID=A2QRD3_ASPNC|nr:hypothetical protein An08g05620 [Aspergillus niger]CAK45534.1 hypothetical protein An08g05620 [Aspergillus niger]
MQKADERSKTLIRGRSGSTGCDQQRPGSGTKSTEKKQEGVSEGQHSAGEISAGAGGFEQ